MIQSLPMIIYLAAALVVTRIPYIRTYLSMCYTLLREVFMVIISGRKNKRIRLLKNESTQEIHVPSTFKQDLINYVSYTATSVIAIGMFYLVSINNYHMILYLLIGLIAITIIFWIRTPLEILWGLSFIALLALPIYFKLKIIIIPAAIFLASFILIQSVLNAVYLCKESFAGRKRKGIIAKVKWIPSMILGLILFTQSLYAGYFIVSNYIYHIRLPWTQIEFVQLPWV